MLSPHVTYAPGLGPQSPHRHGARVASRGKRGHGTDSVDPDPCRTRRGNGGVGGGPLPVQACKCQRPCNHVHVPRATYVFLLFQLFVSPRSSRCPPAAMTRSLIMLFTGCRRSDITCMLLMLVAPLKALPSKWIACATTRPDPPWIQLKRPPYTKHRWKPANGRTASSISWCRRAAPACHCILSLLIPCSTAS